MSETAIIILAAGKGSRMKSGLPKVLHQIAGKSMLGHVLSAAKKLNPKLLVLVLGPNMEKVGAAMAVEAPEIEIVVQEERLGTGHAVLMAKKSLKGFEGNVLILYGDVPLIMHSTLNSLLTNLSENTEIAVLAFERNDNADYGRLEVNSDGVVDKIVEAHEINSKNNISNLCNSGIMAVRSKHIFDLLEVITNNNTKGEYYLTDIVKHARSNNMRCMYSTATENEVMGINDRIQLSKAEKLMQQRLRNMAMVNGVTLIDPESTWLSADTVFGVDVIVGPNTVFGPGVVLEDNVEIRAFCHLEGALVRRASIVGPYARLRPGSEIGESAHIGNFVEIKQTRVEEGAKINHLSYIGDARVGAGSNIGAGTITCNYDGYVKSLTDIGVNSFIGSNSALVAPVKIGDGAVVAAGSVITDNVASDSIAVARGTQTERSGAAARRRDRKKKKG